MIVKPIIVLFSTIYGSLVWTMASRRLMSFVELKAKKVFVHHVDTVRSSKVTANILQSFVPNHVDASKSKTKSEDPRRSFNTKKKQDQLLVKAKQKQEILSKNARFEQIWRSRKGKIDVLHEEAIREMCNFYDVVRVDVEETTNGVQKEVTDTDLEDHMMMSSYLPLLREFIPSAAAEIESDIHDYMSKHNHAFEDGYVYDLYAVKDDISIPEEDASNPFPLVQVDDDDSFYNGPSDSDYESDDSNAENNPLNDYPDEEPSEDEKDVKSSSSDDKSEELESASGSDESVEPQLETDDSAENEDLMYEDEFYSDDDDKAYDKE
ncbi:unnamed protein product [Ilex paraguariensis]|uniref:Transcription factor Iwr1 domain-containing protein n=1 Tax=Ilex paraguariensis TaxID=185542 RepID=A0ABC8T9F5_9AQUA